VLGTIDHHIDKVSDLVAGEVVFHADSTMLSESFSEKLSSLSSKPVGVSHLKDLLKLYKFPIKSKTEIISTRNLIIIQVSPLG
jgi:hypothetical protein